MTAEQTERRQGERRYFKITVVCQLGPRGDERSIFGQVTNISTSGAQILCRGDILSGEELELTFLNERRETIATSHAIVVWHQKEGPGAYRIGVQLGRELSYEELSKIA